MTQSLNDVTTQSAPTRVRWLILLFVFLISVVTVVDRVNISVAAQYIMPEYGLSQVQMGTIFSAFILGYTAGFIPGGWLGDRLGPRVVLTGALLVWSLLTIVTAWAGDIFLTSLVGVGGSFLCIRFLFGMGEGPAYPNSNRLTANWFPLTEKAVATSVALAGVGVGAMIAPPLVAWIMVEWGWRTAFYVTGLAGVFVAASWYYYGRDYPEEHRAVNHAELQWIRSGNDSHSPQSAISDAPSLSTPWRALLSSRDLWLMIASYLGLTYVAYTFVSWFYLYVVNELHFSVQTGAWLSTLPFVTIVFFSPGGGMLSDALVQTVWGAGRSDQCRVREPHPGCPLSAFGRGNNRSLCVDRFAFARARITLRHGSCVLGQYHRDGQRARGDRQRAAPDRRASRWDYRSNVVSNPGGALWVDAGVRVSGRRGVALRWHLRLRASRETTGCAGCVCSFPHTHASGAV